MAQRKRYVLVEAQLEPRLVGGTRRRATSRARRSTKIEVERGLRVRLAPQGITGTNYLELDYVDPLPTPVLPIDWVPDNIYIPSAPSTVTHVRQRGHRRSSTGCIELDIEATLANLNKLLATANDRVARPSTPKAPASRSAPTARSPRSSRRSTPSQAKKLSDEARRAHRRAARRPTPSSRRSLANPALQKLPDDTSAARRAGAHARRRPEARRSRSRTWSARSAGSTGSSAAARRTSASRSRTCARSPTTCATSPKTRSAIRRT